MFRIFAFNHNSAQFTARCLFSAKNALFFFSLSIRQIRCANEAAFGCIPSKCVKRSAIGGIQVGNFPSIPVLLRTLRLLRLHSNIRNKTKFRLKKKTIKKNVFLEKHLTDRRTVDSGKSDRVTCLRNPRDIGLLNCKWIK